MSEPITNAADAVAALGALPVPVGPTPMSDERFAEIRNRKLNEVTSGPWLVADGDGGKPVVYVERPMDDGRVGALVLLAADAASEADVQFVGSARRSVPELIAEVERLRARITELERQLADAPVAVTLTGKAAESADRLTALLAPSQALREDESEEHCDHPNGYGPYGCAGCGAFADGGEG